MNVTKFTLWYYVYSNPVSIYIAVTFNLNSFCFTQTITFTGMPTTLLSRLFKKL